MTHRPTEPVADREGQGPQLCHSLRRLLLKSWFCCLSLLTIGCLVRTPALQGPFLWDDTYLAITNPFIKSPLLILESFRHYLFLDSYSTHYRPVQNISFIPDYYWWGDNPFGFHLANIAWHAAAGLMLFLLLRRLLADLPLTRLSFECRHLLAFLVALLWVVHPVHSAAVDYVSGRADSISFFLAASAWLTSVSAQKLISHSGRAVTYAAAFFLGLLALCARESALIWVMLFLVHQLFVDRRTSRTTRFALVGAGVMLIAIYAGLRHLPAPRSQVLVAPGWPPATRAVLMLRALGDYARLMIFPVNLHMERTIFDPTLLRDSAHWASNPRVEYLSLVGLAVIAAFVIAARRREAGRDLRIVGAGWFLLSYLPTSNLISLNATVAEHWLYLPSVGFLLFLTGCTLALPQRTRHVMVVIAAIFAVGLSVRSYYRSADWSSAERFFQQTLAAGGSSRAATNLALIYSRRGEFARAEHLLRRVLILTPDDPIARNNMADALNHLGRRAEAEKILLAATKDSEKLRKDYPRTWVVAANLARLRHAQNDDTAAFALLDAARKEYPDVWELVSCEAELLRKDEGPQAAQKIVEQFARRNWWHYGATLALGRVIAEKGNAAEATAILTRASYLDLHDTEALNLIARIRLRQHRLTDAYRAQRKAIDRQPDAPRQYAFLSDILQKMGRTAEAEEAQAQGKRLQKLARQNLALLN